ncbi:dynein axonemal assembly factor 6 [Daktulosphaira vitifoliae]|uniref:dynein axonemal assembly factor 6 n=1 Tax=Daktulosphaira vitifoliae TaxID=58002 RepID=UPI0021A9DFC2|nr:dynein axonemal assembly factor 6 [Daktulosphaira vitifoliae]
MDFMDMKKLSELLNPKVNSSDSEDDLPKQSLVQLCKSKTGKDVKIITKDCITNEKSNASGKIIEIQTINDLQKDIWQIDDIIAVPEAIDVKADIRSKPEYEVKFQQYVGTEDVFLQMGLKTPLTSSCEAMVIIVKLPNEQYADICMDVSDEAVEVRSPKYRMHLPFQHNVHKQLSKSSWNSNTSTLTITVFLKREFDFDNF